MPTAFSRPARGPEQRRRTDRFPVDQPLPLIYRFAPEPSAEARVEGPLAREAVLARVEAVLLAADEPLSLRRLGQAADIEEGAEVRRLIQRLQGLYEQEGAAFQVEELAGGYQLLTRPEFHPWLVRLRRTGSDLRLTPASRETLAIVAFRQPIMRAEIEAIRGVHCAEVLRLLMERGLVRIAGRDNSLGRPVLYGTTKKFLQVFGMRSLKDLPESEHLGPKKDDSEAGLES